MDALDEFRITCIAQECCISEQDVLDFILFSDLQTDEIYGPADLIADYAAASSKH